MGNDTSQSQSSQQGEQSFIKQFRHYYDYAVEKSDKRFGDICIYKHKTEQRFIAKRGQLCSSSEEYHQFLHQCKQNLNIKQKNILTLFYAQQANEENFCGEFNNITLFFEYQFQDLEKEINRRRSNGLDFFTEKELCHILDSVIQACIYLEKQKTCNGDIRPATIFFTPENQVKIADNQILHINQSSYNRALFKGEKCYLSPLLLRSLKVKEQRPFHDQQKSDIYSLGMTLIEAASLCTPFASYDLNTYQISHPIIEQLLTSLRGRYSEFFVDVIIDMLQDEESDRPTFQTLNSTVSPFYNSLIRNPKEISPSQSVVPALQNQFQQSNISIQSPSVYAQENSINNTQNLPANSSFVAFNAQDLGYAQQPIQAQQPQLQQTSPSFSQLPLSQIPQIQQIPLIIQSGTYLPQQIQSQLQVPQNQQSLQNLQQFQQPYANRVPAQPAIFSTPALLLTSTDQEKQKHPQISPQTLNTIGNGQLSSYSSKQQLSPLLMKSPQYVEGGSQNQLESITQNQQETMREIYQPKQTDNFPNNSTSKGNPDSISTQNQSAGPKMNSPPVQYSYQPLQLFQSTTQLPLPSSQQQAISQNFQSQQVPTSGEQYHPQVLQQQIEKLSSQQVQHSVLIPQQQIAQQQGYQYQQQQIPQQIVAPFMPQQHQQYQQIQQSVGKNVPQQQVVLQGNPQQQIMLQGTQQSQQNQYQQPQQQNSQYQFLLPQQSSQFNQPQQLQQQNQNQQQLPQQYSIQQGPQKSQQYQHQIPHQQIIQQGAVIHQPSSSNQQFIPQFTQQGTVPQQTLLQSYQGQGYQGQTKEPILPHREQTSVFHQQGANYQAKIPSAQAQNRDMEYYFDPFSLPKKGLSLESANLDI